MTAAVFAAKSLVRASKTFYLLSMCPNPWRYLWVYAGRWAAKEAAAKALGCGIGQECAFNEIEVVDSEIGVPSLVFSGSAARTAAALGARNVRVSITHEREYAAAVVIIEE